ncbi:alkene reductase [Marinifilum caeruleilacunae]|uniref:Alkene reductase n=1 Tax=Marinifilum caeruleilacunae TaxID=2499076 RepID=A0ABX1WSW1_9BACT|nr:alkene reductase [Marinifilum caeruleilacunae]NOU59186.1 alkene reductase [Marinifilum caeruleilacunae]
MTKNTLLSNFSMGDLQLKNRMVMAPMTRNRAGEGNVPTPLMAEYYKQRSGAGLIITEASQISPQGMGYPATPGIHTSQQVDGWKLITNAVHDQGGKIFIQLWHVGRISHPDFHGGDLPVAPSAIQPAGQAFTYEGLKDFVKPRALENIEIKAIVNDYKQAAQNAKDAGFDGIELHAANGYLIDQFLVDRTNQRDDEYGGSVENRARFLFEVLDAVNEVWPKNRIGIRLSPSGLFNDMGDSNPMSIFTYVIEKLNAYELAYLHLIEPLMPIDEHPQLIPNVIDVYGDLYSGVRMANGGFTKDSGNLAIADEKTELVSYGVPYLANPDLEKRFELNAELNTAKQDTFYGGNEVGYTDYPSL